jgi:hypothetical protein
MTTLPVGTVAGAVYIVTAPLAVEDRLKVPQEPEGEQPQFTPPLAESLETFAETEAVPPMLMAPGGAVAKATEIAGGGGGFPPPELPPPQAQRKAKPTKSRGTTFQFIGSPGRARIWKPCIGM